MNISFDKRLSTIWNTLHHNDMIAPEHMWEICRELCDLGLLQHDVGAVSAVKVGPFKIVTSLTPTNSEALGFFLESIFPMVITEYSSNITFEDAYPLYILPAVKLFEHMLANSYFIKDENVWKAIMYIKEENKKGIFPTVYDIGQEFAQNRVIVDPQKIITECLQLKNNMGDPKPILMIDDDGGIHSIV